MLSFLIVFLFICVVILIYAEFVEPRWFKVKRVAITTSKPLPRPISILHLSDIHFCGSDKEKEKFFGKLNEFNPDFIFVTGDIIDCDAGIDQAVRLIGGLKCRVGKFAVMGNHDYWDYSFVSHLNYHLRGIKISNRPTDSTLFIKKMKEAGIKMLINDNVSLTLEGKKITIAGTDDPVTKDVDFEKTLRGVQNDSFNILLTHVIDSIVQLPKVSIDVAFAGHTHGGQFRVPLIGGFMYGFRLPRKYLDGIHQVNEMVACVSRGLGAGRTLVLRFFCRPEAILMEVTPK